MRNLVAEARRAGMISSEEAARLTDIPNIKQAGTRKGNRLTREQAKEISPFPIARSSKANGITSFFLFSWLVRYAGQNLPNWN